MLDRQSPPLIALLGFAGAAVVAAMLGFIYSIFALGEHPAWYFYFPMVFTGVLFLEQSVSLVLLGLGYRGGSLLATVGILSLHSVFYGFVFVTQGLSLLSASPSLRNDGFLFGYYVVFVAVAGLLAACCLLATLGQLWRKPWARSACFVASWALMATVLGAPAGGLALFVLWRAQAPQLPSPAQRAQLSPDGAWWWGGTEWRPT